MQDINSRTHSLDFHKTQIVVHIAEKGFCFTFKNTLNTILNILSQSLTLITEVHRMCGISK